MILFRKQSDLADKIRSLHESGVPLTEIAVFYRLQSQSEILSKVLEKHQIPYEISQKKIIQDIPVLAWFLHILRFLSNHEDLTSGTYVLCDKNFRGRMDLKKGPDRDSEFYTRERISLEILTFSGHVGVSGHRLRLHKSVGTAFSGKISPTVFQRL